MTKQEGISSRLGVRPMLPARRCLIETYEELSAGRNVGGNAIDWVMEGAS